MPGEKRKLEEENTWLPRQSKKIKKAEEGQQPSHVYYSTLSKLRNGARSFFALGSQATTASSRSCDTCLRSTLSRSTFQVQSTLPCTFCEKVICHLNRCNRCNLEFCTSCSMQNYDGEDQLSDNFICISCFAGT